MLRNSANTAEWTFDPADLCGSNNGSVYLNLSALVAKGRDGGSAYNGYLHVTFIGDRRVNLGITLYNHFRPKAQIATGGVGYASGSSAQMGRRQMRRPPIPLRPR